MALHRLIMLVFLVQPVAFGSWLVRIPEVQLQLGLSPAELALALLGMPVGILLTLPFGGRIIHHTGARPLLIGALIASHLMLLLPPLAPSMPLLFAALAINGAVFSLLELAMNVEADRIEKATGKFIMSTCHGFWSVGMTIGSLVGNGWLQVGLPPFWSLLASSAVMVIVTVSVAWQLPKEAPDASATSDGDSSHMPRLPSLGLVVVCLFTFGITMTEGAMADWGGIYLRDAIGSEPSQTGYGYTLFAAMVAFGRFLGDHMKARIGAVRAAQFTAFAALIGLGIFAISNSFAVALIGFATVGFGVSLGFPLAVTAASAAPGPSPASNVATLAFIALTGFLVGPPMIGWVSDHVGIRYGLMTLVPAIITSLLLARFLTQKKASAGAP